MTPKMRRKPNPWGRAYRVTRGGKVVAVRQYLKELRKKAHRSRARKGHAKSLDYWQGMINC